MLQVRKYAPILPGEQLSVGALRTPFLHVTVPLPVEVKKGTGAPQEMLHELPLARRGEQVPSP